MPGLPDQIREMCDAGALFAVNHSAGKDSQAMLIHLRNIGIPDDQMVVVHADLGEVEWPGNVAHIEANSFRLPLIIAEPKTGFFDMVERRGMFPSAAQRQCTSDLKRGPIERELRRFLKENPRFGGRLVNCMGMRVGESPARAKKAPLQRSARNSKAGREWWDWLPIHELSTEEVFEAIAQAGQEPHPAYGLGMTRLSCCFCILASASDLRISAGANPRLYARYCKTEIRLGHTLSMSRKSLPEITGIAPCARLLQAA